MNVERSSLPIQAESAPTTLAKQLLESWKDPEYRSEFVRERVRSSVALQIRALREQRKGMTQKQLGDAIGKKQTWISVLEDPEYGKMSVATLLSLAGAFDTDLEIKFRPFSKALHELTRQSASYFEVRSFTEELPDLENASHLGWITPKGEWSDILRAASLLAPQEAPKGLDVPSTMGPVAASGAIQPQSQPNVQADSTAKAAYLFALMGTPRAANSEGCRPLNAKRAQSVGYSRKLGRFGRRNYFSRKELA
jgi:transcriptional regulator with XRE-family HTH domain